MDRWAWALMSSTGWLDTVSETRTEVVSEAERIMGISWKRCKRLYGMRVVKVRITLLDPPNKTLCVKEDRPTT